MKPKPLPLGNGWHHEITGRDREIRSYKEERKRVVEMSIYSKIYNYLDIVIGEVINRTFLPVAPLGLYVSLGCILYTYRPSRTQDVSIWQSAFREQPARLQTSPTTESSGEQPARLQTSPTTESSGVQTTSEVADLAYHGIVRRSRRCLHI